MCIVNFLAMDLLQHTNNKSLLLQGRVSPPSQHPSLTLWDYIGTSVSLSRAQLSTAAPPPHDR